MESLSPSSQSSSQPSSSSSPSILPPLITNPPSSTSLTPTRARSSSSNSRRRKKKMKTQTQSQQVSSQNPNPNSISNPNKFSWKSESTQQLYTSKLLQAFRHLRLSNPNPNPNIPRRRGRAVKEAADRVLATAAHGRTRWSRAILSGSLRRLKFTHKKLTRRRIPTITGDTRRNTSPEIMKLKVKTKDIPAVQRKAKVLGKLVPGCRKESFPVVLEEAVDYIPALEMQVRTLRQILALFGGAGENSGENSGGISGEGTSSGGEVSPENGSG